MSTQPQSHASSTGQAYTGAAWLDTHFEAYRPEYEAQLRAVGIRSGWRVLDAGAGSGSYLPLLADLVGPTGRIAAFDLAPDNVARIAAQLADQPLTAPVETQVGSLLALPYPDASFDAVWCANTTQYLTDAELDTALREMRRVVRPGGLIALKEADVTLQRILPAPIAIMLHAHEQGMRAGIVTSHGCLRACMLHAWLRNAGLVQIERRTTLIERSAPLAPASRAYLRSLLVSAAGFLADHAEVEEDRAFWRRLRDPASVESLLDAPDFYSSAGNILAVGQVPERAGTAG